ncbi:hypothetical protein CIHG_10089 [Coccidioides immitis H538.4]|uniref:Uncharacterized protein n=1 Tax=Coccidioides immitis H538.4 TaxID=396776 RepID=A0A0J8S634_COCIT|nr:hypothetical protein CIHG_10089 [Coccidioides immitis H538.4]
MNITGNILLLNSVMAMTYYKYVTVNINNMKLVLDISVMIRSNYFDLINAPDCSISTVSISAGTTCYLHFVSALPTTSAAAPSPLLSHTTISLSLSNANRVSTCQMTDIRAPVWFPKLVLKKQEEKKKKKKKKKKREKKKEKKNNNNNKNNNNDENNNNNKNDELAI